MPTLTELIGVEREAMIVITNAEVNMHCCSHRDSNVIHSSAKVAEKLGVYGGVVIPGWLIAGRAIGQIFDMFEDAKTDFSIPLLRESKVVFGDHRFIPNEPIYICWKITDSKIRPGNCQIVCLEGRIKNFQKREIHTMSQKIVFV